MHRLQINRLSTPASNKATMEPSLPMPGTSTFALRLGTNSSHLFARSTHPQYQLNCSAGSCIEHLVRCIVTKNMHRSHIHSRRGEGTSLDTSPSPRYMSSQYSLVPYATQREISCSGHCRRDSAGWGRRCGAAFGNETRSRGGGLDRS